MTTETVKTHHPKEPRYIIYINYDSTFYIACQDDDDVESFPQKGFDDFMDYLKNFLDSLAFPNWIESRMYHFTFIRHLIKKGVFNDG